MIEESSLGSEKEYQDDFIDLYLDYTKGQESPRDFHFWTAVSLLSGAVGRKIWLPRGHDMLYPNHYVILVAGSAMSRKSSAINIGVGLLRRATQNKIDSGLTHGISTILSGKMTPEALCRAISSRGLEGMLETDAKPVIAEKTSRPCYLFSSELGVFLSKAAQSNGLVDLLIDWYDCPDVFEYITKTSGSDYVYEVFVSLLSATTPDWIAQNVTSSVFNQGFVGRVIFVHSERSNIRIAHPVVDSALEKLRDRLVTHIEHRMGMEGEMELTRDAWDYFEAWYNKREELPGLDNVQSGFFGREHTHVLKLAMTYSIARRRTLRIHKVDIKDAIGKIAHTFEGLTSIFKEVRYANEIFETKIVEGIIKDAKTIDRSTLLRNVYRKMNKDKLDECLSILKAAGVINEDVKTRKGGGRAKVTYTTNQ
jgi:hypothetical protein